MIPNPIIISSWEEYHYCIERGYQPLLNKFIQMEINFRIEVQKAIFGHCIIGRGDIPQANERFYRWCWDHKPHYCEETMKPLRNYSAVYISHILTRGAHPEMALDPRNTNILDFMPHQDWESEITRHTMRIYPANQLVIEQLKNEYQIK